MKHQSSPSTIAASRYSGVCIAMQCRELRATQLRHIAIAICGALVAVSLSPAAVRADSTTTNVTAADAKSSPSDEFADKRAQLALRIAKLNPPADADAEPAKIAPEAEEELDLLRSLDMVYLERKAATDQLAEVELERKGLQDEIDALHTYGPAETKPYSFLLWEDLRDQLSGEQQRGTALDADLAAAQKLLGTVRANFETCEQQRRAAHETATENKHPAEQAGLDRELRLAELTSQIAQQNVELCRTEIDVKTARRGLSKARQTFLDEKAGLIAKGVKYTEHDYQARLTELAQRGAKLRTALKNAEGRLHQHETKQAETLAQLGADKADAALLAAAGEAFALARRADCEEITMINQRTAELEHFKHFVTCRYEMMNHTASHESLVEWRTQLAELLEQLSATERSLAIRIDEIHVDQGALFERADDAATRDARLKPWIELQAEQLRTLAEHCESSLVHLKARHRSLERFHDELDAATEVRAAAHPLAALRESVSTVWDYQLANVGDDPITVGKIVSGIFYLLVGVVVARLLSGLVGRSLLPRFGLNEGAIHAIRAITFYALCVLFSFEILKLIHVPFASFTFLGGAVAIAVGFGCQNILNNFISGLILLAEQPIRVGDHVEIDGTRGMVQSIGARSTRVKTISNHEMIVPNSKLLEDKVTNLTLSDNLVRTVVAVSLARCLPIDDMRRQLLAAATQHAQVLSDPPPEVLLMSFSKTDVAFELHFWLRMSDLMECRVVESKVRSSVSKLFADADTDSAKPANAAQPAGSAQPAESAKAADSAKPAAADVVPPPHIPTSGAPSLKLPERSTQPLDTRKAG